MGARTATRAFFAATALTLFLMTSVTASVAAAPTVCRVTNADTGETYGALQPAVDAARKGDRLTVRGTCRGRTTVKKDVGIRGVRMPGYGSPILEPEGKTKVIDIWYHTTVSLKTITVRGGVSDSNPAEPGGDGCGGGGGIRNLGTLMLRSVTVRDNRAANYGGGICNMGTLSLTGRTRIVGNRATEGGGLYSRDGTVTLSDRSRISHNRAFQGGGVANRHRSILTLNDLSRISDNEVSDAGSMGGGVANDARVILNDFSRISRNHTSGRASMGGGIAGGYVEMSGSSAVVRNTALRGGGVYAFSLTMSDASVIVGNTGHKNGGGVWGRSFDTFVGVNCGGNVHGNKPNDCNIE